MYCEYREFQKKYNCIGGVMVNVLASSVVDRGFEPQSDQTKDYKIFSNFSAISWREHVNFQWDDDEVRFVLDTHAELENNSPSQPVFALSP
jgi:hypothetical protein